MERRVAAFEARRSFGKIIGQGVARGDCFVVERHGEPVAAVVPIEVYDQWKRSREELVQRWQQIAEQSNLSTEDADELADEAVRSIRTR